MQHHPVSSIQKARRDVFLLALASLAAVTAIAAAIGTGVGGVGDAGWKLPVLIALAAGASLAASLFVARAALKSGVAAKRAQDEAAELRTRLALAEAITRAEPQVLVYWQPDSALKVVTHTLTGIAGLPADTAEVLRFGSWLDGRAADELKGALDGLFTGGRSFNLILMTKAGAHLEADGRTAGARATLRLRDVAGYKKDLGRIISEHQLLARDIRSSRALLNALPMPVWKKDQDGRLAWVNPAYVRAVEATGEAEVLEKQIELLESRQRKAIDRALARGMSFRERLSIVVGRERKAHDVIVLPLGDATVAAAIDIAELETAQGELDRQITAYHRSLNRVSTAIAIFGADKRLSFFNDAFAQLWRLDAEWLKSGPSDGAVLDQLREQRKLPEVINYRDWKAKTLAACLATGSHQDTWRLPDGRTLSVIGEQQPDGGVTYLYADETERVALETSYNALISVQRETLDSLKEGVAVFATDGRLKLFNSAFMRIWKMSPSTLIEEPHIDEIVSLCRVLHDEPRAWRPISGAVTSLAGERQNVEGKMSRPDQSVIEYAAMPLPDGATLVTFADVTDAKRYERALVERNEALVAGDRLKSQFIGHISYELRTPLQTIIGYSQMLETMRDPLTPRQREYLSHVSQSSSTLLEIVDNILDLATIDAGAVELKRGHVDIKDVLKSAIEGVRERAQSMGLVLDIALADDAHELTADEDRLRQIVYNLISNAVGFSRQGGTVQVGCWRERDDFVIEIADQGVGIPAEQLKRVFERFESRSQGSQHRGAGLGLSIVKSLVELHGGTMAISSQPERGTTVTVRLPQRAASADDIDAAA